MTVQYSDDSSDQDSLPPLLARKTVDSDSDDSDDDDSLPPLLNRQADQSDSSDDGSDDDSDDDLPPLLARQADQSDSDDSSEAGDLPFMQSTAPKRKKENSRREAARKKEEARRREEMKRREETRRRQEEEKRRRAEVEAKMREEEKRRAEAEKQRLKKKKQKARKKIFSFVQKNLLRKKAEKKVSAMLYAVRGLQALCRGRKARQIWSEPLQVYQENSRLFHQKWDKCLDRMDSLSPELKSWVSIRDAQQADFIKAIEAADGETQQFVQEDDGERAQTLSKLDNAMSSVLESGDIESERTVEEPASATEMVRLFSAISTSAVIQTSEIVNTETYINIQYTSHVEKWLKAQQGNVYKDFFVRRMRQLANGDKSRILAKRLSGSKTTIYETYLEQKSGMRILWTYVFVFVEFESSISFSFFITSSHLFLLFAVLKVATFWSGMWPSMTMFLVSSVGSTTLRVEL